LIIMDVDEWNTRPIEDALNARIAELEAEIAKLKAENAKLETERRWIPLNERQPEVGSNVVLVNANKGKEYYALQVSEWMVDELDMFHTHWMPLPEPPEAEE
ncbi:MAG TPA: DUF551 domain-containing protein, partial [Anaerolineaceae bacterium]|nr:DUF551 domain-containing protein [Anaerolineaceae bacterium]